MSSPAPWRSILYENEPRAHPFVFLFLVVSSVNTLNLYEDSSVLVRTEQWLFVAPDGSLYQTLYRLFDSGVSVSGVD